MLNRNFFAFALGAICLFLLLVGSARSEETGKFVILVASPHLDGAYRETAVLVAGVNGRHLGFILNRSSETRLAELFPRHAPSAKVVDPVYFGGPDANRALFAAVRNNPGRPALQVTDDLWITGSAPVVDSIIEKSPNDARYFLGFVSWAPGELEDELARGYWLLGEAEAELVFRKDTSGMWEEQVKRLSGGVVRPRAGQRVSSAAGL
jgi:putative transcriptional regulator